MYAYSIISLLQPINIESICFHTQVYGLSLVLKLMNNVLENIFSVHIGFNYLTSHKLHVQENHKSVAQTAY